MKRITPVILSGGSGTRLWPLSTAGRPKQFHALVGDTSMFAQTLARVRDRQRFDPPTIVCGAGHSGYVRADLAAHGIEDATIIIEPAARNTAPAIALAALAGEPDALLLVMPSDHVIADSAAFLDAVERARGPVVAGALATFGIAATTPHTGYGYIESGEQVAQGVHRVARFVEKPDAGRAAAMIESGGHYWNAGIFLMRADAYLAALAAHAPGIAAAATAAMRDAARDGATITPDAAAFAACPAQSIDYAVMEHAAGVVTVPVACGWSDLGSWQALYEIAGRDADDNAVAGDAALIDARGNLVHAAPGMRVSLLGIDDLIIVATPGEIVILPRARAEEVKRLAT